MSINSNLTIVIQGNLQQETLEFYKQNYYSYNVIISTWTNNHTVQSIGEIPENWIIVKNRRPRDHGHQNIYLQIYSTLYGLEKVNTKYCIKMRADEYISNIDYIYKYILNNDNKLYTLPIWFRRWDHFAYHISDHLIAGSTDNLRLMFKTALNRQKDHVAEVVLTRGYLEQKIPDIYQKYEDKSVMKKYFDILNLEYLKPYLLIANCYGARFYSNFIPEHHASASNIDDI